MDQDLYSVEQVAEQLGLHVKTVRNYVRDGRLKAVRIGKQYRMRISRPWLESNPSGVKSLQSLCFRGIYGRAEERCCWTEISGRSGFRLGAGIVMR